MQIVIAVNTLKLSITCNSIDIGSRVVRQNMSKDSHFARLALEVHFLNRNNSRSNHLRFLREDNTCQYPKVTHIPQMHKIAATLNVLESSITPNNIDNRKNILQLQPSKYSKFARLALEVRFLSFISHNCRSNCLRFLEEDDTFLDFCKLLNICHSR